MNWERSLHYQSFPRKACIIVKKKKKSLSKHGFSNVYLPTNQLWWWLIRYIVITMCGRDTALWLLSFFFLLGQDVDFRVQPPFSDIGPCYRVLVDECEWRWYLLLLVWPLRTSWVIPSAHSFLLANWSGSGRGLQGLSKVGT